MMIVLYDVLMMQACGNVFLDEDNKKSIKKIKKNVLPVHIQVGVHSGP